VGGVDPDTRDENGWTLLRTAAWSGQVHCVQVRENSCWDCCGSVNIFSDPDPKKVTDPSDPKFSLFHNANDFK
jgi:hypothetical protein